MNYSLIYFPDGSFQVATGKADPENYMPGSKIYRVSGDLTIADISGIYATGGFERDCFPIRLESLLQETHRNIPE